jgi:hypothetical protein
MSDCGTGVFVQQPVAQLPSSIGKTHFPFCPVYGIIPPEARRLRGTGLFENKRRKNL